MELKNVHEVIMGDVIDYALDTAKPDLDHAFNEGYEDGYNDAMRTYEVKFPCAKCGALHVSITSEQAKEEAARFMYQHGWHSPDCR